ncbi:MAG: efflux RND transporter periplasmic adaptor subunit [Candidatus Omnitrophota bacterium]
MRLKIILAAVVLTALLTATVCVAQAVEKTSTEQKISYWTCSMHPSVHAEKKGKCPICGMDLIPVYETAEPQQDEAVQANEDYYGCGVTEQGHCKHCDEGIKDAQCICGGHSFVITADKQMSCPVCKKPLKKIKPEQAAKLRVQNGETAVSRVSLNKQQVDLAGIKTEPIKKRSLSKLIRASGTIAYDPELAVAQEEFLTAVQTREKVGNSPDPDVIARADDILNRSKTRLKLLGLSDEYIASLQNQTTADQSLILPQDKMWAYAQIYEYELGWVKPRQEAKITTDAYPGEEFKGAVVSINPVIDPKTRSARVRIEVDNPDLKLKPQMYVNVVIEDIYTVTQNEDGMILAVPKDAVLDTGVRKIVYIQAKEGEFVGREIKIGSLASAEEEGIASQFYPVLSGLSEGDVIVTKGNFLIDSQSQLTGGASLLWSGAQEIEAGLETPAEEEPKIETKHIHH